MADTAFLLEAPDPMADPLFAAVARISATTYTATSSDGAATVVVGGDQRVRSVQVLRSDHGPLRVGVAISQATNAALEPARRGAVVSGPTQQVISVVVGRLDGMDAVGAAAVEAINKALDLAGGLSGLDERIAARMAAFDASMERITNRLENLAADLEGLLEAE